MTNEEKIEQNEETPVETAEEEAKEQEPEVDLEEKLKESEDKYLRLYAEFDNFKKRSQKEKISCYTDAIVDAVAEFLPVMDNLERALALEVTSDEAKAVKDGVEMVKKQMLETFSKLKITEIKALGEEFDPNFHNAVMHIEDEAVTENTVVEEFMKGYIYNNEKVVRHSMVKVAN